MKKLLSLLLFAAMTVTSAWGETYNGAITFSTSVSNYEADASYTFNSIAAGSNTLTITSPETSWNGGFLFMTINVSGGGINQTFNQSTLQATLTSAGISFEQVDGQISKMTNSSTFSLGFTTTSAGNVTVTIHYKGWNCGYTWPLTLTDSSAPADIRIAATKSRTEIYTTGDFTGLFVSSVNSAISSDDNATFRWEYSSDNSSWNSGDSNLPDNDTHNNIRPTMPGYYRCVATLSDGTTSYTSNTIQITNKHNGDHGCRCDASAKRQCENNNQRQYGCNCNKH